MAAHNARPTLVTITALIAARRDKRRENVQCKAFDPRRLRMLPGGPGNFRMCALALFVEGQFPQCPANLSCSVFFKAFFETKFRSKQIVPRIVICEPHNQLSPFVRDFRQLCFHQKSGNNVFGTPILIPTRNIP